MRTINEIMKKMWEADTDQELQLMITLNPSVVRIEQCMREYAIEIVEEIDNNPDKYIAKWGAWDVGMKPEEIKRQINEQ